MISAAYFPAPDQTLASAIVRAKAIPHNRNDRLFFNGRALAWFPRFRAGWALISSVTKEPRQ